MTFCRYSAIWILLLFTVKCFSQQYDSASNSIRQVPGKYYSKVDTKLTSVNTRLTKKSEKYLRILQRHETRIRGKFQQIDPVASDKLFSNAGKEYQQFFKQITGRVKEVTAGSGQYIPYLDSLGTSLKFLNKPGGANSKAGRSLSNLTLLQDKLKQSQNIKEYISQRKEQIKNMLSGYTKLPATLKKQFAKLNKAAYYYSAQINEYKEILKNSSKAERKALTLLNKLPAFQKFMQKNSQLASMFSLPDNSGVSPGITGLQTRSSIQAIIQQQVGTGGPNAQQVIQQNIAEAYSKLDNLKDKINKIGAGSSDIEIPDFKANAQKTKSFLKRLEYGANVQFSKSSSLFPSATNIGLSLGYKVNDKSIIGAGISYKMGMGTLSHIVISHQGIGLRSFADYKIRSPFVPEGGGLYISAGYEMNYNTAFKNIEQLKTFNDWQSSGLIGISKKYAVSKKVKGEIKLLYDFLASAHKPVTQPLIFRLGYGLNK